MKNLVLILALLLASCGFHLRGEAPMPFGQVAITPEKSGLGLALKRALQTGGRVEVVAAGPRVYRLEILKELIDRVILSLDAAGQVREYQLQYKVAFRLKNPEGDVVIPMSELKLSRIMSYDNTQILAKTSEADLLYRNMRDDAVNQIMRRLSAYHPNEN